MAHLTDPHWTPPTQDAPPAPPPGNRSGVTPPSIDPPAAEAATGRAIAKELRRLADSPVVLPGQHRGRLRELANVADQLATETTTVTGELDATTAGLDPEQEIRADALTAAARLLAPLLSQMSLSGAEANIDGIAAMWLRLADRGAGLIRDGSRPDHAICACRRERSISEPGQPLMEVRNPDCPTHGAGARP